MHRIILIYMFVGSAILAALGAFAQHQGRVPHAFVLINAIMVASCLASLVFIAVRRLPQDGVGRALMLLGATSLAFMVAPIAGAWAI